MIHVPRNYLKLKSLPVTVVPVGMANGLNGRSALKNVLVESLVDINIMIADLIQLSKKEHVELTDGQTGLFGRNAHPHALVQDQDNKSISVVLSQFLKLKNADLVVLILIGHHGQFVLKYVMVVSHPDLEFINVALPPKKNQRLAVDQDIMLYGQHGHNVTMIMVI